MEANPLIRSKVILVEGKRDQILSFTTNLVAPRLSPSRTIYVLPGEEETAAVKGRLALYGFDSEFFDYDSLTSASTSWFRGKSIVIDSPVAALDRAEVKGRIDAALLRVLASRSRRQVIMTSEASGDLHTQEVTDISKVASWIAKRLSLDPLPDTWLDELLLELLYERHAYLAEIQRLVRNTVWWQSGSHDAGSVRKALRNLANMGLVLEERGRYFTSTRLGRLIVEGRLPISRSNLAELQRLADAERTGGTPVDYDLERQRLTYYEDLVLNLIEANGWTTVNGVAKEAFRANVTKTISRGIAHRLLERMASEHILTRSEYQRGGRGPMFVYYLHGSSREADIFENKCGDCAFYTRVAQRCRLWWALSRFNAAQVYSRRDELSVVSRDKLANANTRVGPHATACDYFAPKKRDFPLTEAREICLGCGKEVESPVAKLVKCANCGTAYKPLASKILVSYNYEQIFRDRYLQISGVHPPSHALLIPSQEYYGKRDWRDLIVLYPQETVRFGADGMYVKREDGSNTFQRYEKIYHVVDYGALGPIAASKLERLGTKVVQRSLGWRYGDPSLELYPPIGFVESLRILRQDSRLRRRLSESLLLSVIVATRHIADRGGQTLKVLVNRQLLEYKRMMSDRELGVTRALAYEARVSNLYWSAYKTMLRVSGLDFKSRVRDRYVRELVETARARSRGYSQANAGINYLHQRRLTQCRFANAQAGIGWIGCEGILHVANRKPPIGLLLDLSDPFKLADRQSFLIESLRFKISREDFVARLGRHRLWFFFPSVEGVEKLEDIGSNADKVQMTYDGREMELTAAYREYVNSFVETVTKCDPSILHPFVYGATDDLGWLETELGTGGHGKLHEN